MVEYLDSPWKGEESLDPSTKKQLKSGLSRWRTAPQLQTNQETVTKWQHKQSVTLQTVVWTLKTRELRSDTSLGLYNSRTEVTAYRNT